MDAQLAKVIQATAYLIVGSILMTGGMVAVAIFSTIPNIAGISGAIGSFVGLSLHGCLWFNRGIRSMPFLH